MPRNEPIPFWRQSRESDSRAVTAERLVNWYLEPSQQNPKFPYVLYPTPGLTELFSVGDGPCRGIYAFLGNLYVVSGTRVYLVDRQYASSDLGEIAGGELVSMVHNNTQVLVMAGEHSYVISGTSVIEVPEPDLISATYRDGYGIAIKSGSEQFYISDLDDFTAGWTSFSSADSLADNLVAMVMAGGMLWLFGEESIEHWFHTGASFPFERSQGNIPNIGCMSRESVAVFRDSPIWVGNDHQIYMGQGTQPRVVSTPEISKIVENDNAPNTARGFVYTQKQHSFYVLTMSSKTVVLDLDTGLWAYRQTNGIDRWRAQCYAWQWRKHLVGDYANGSIYELDPDVYTENGSAIVRQADTAPIYAAGMNQILHKVRMDIEGGVGIDGSGQGSTPQMMVQFSKNGGRTWGNERLVGMGQLGNYNTRVNLNNCGMGREISMRIAVSDPVRPVVVGAWMDREILAA